MKGILVFLLTVLTLSMGTTIFYQAKKLPVNTVESPTVETYTNY